MKGDNKYLTYSNTIMNKLNDLNPNKNYFIEDSSSLRMKKSLVPNPDLQDLDTDNANRFAEFIVQLHQDNVDRMPTDLLKTVNTFLFRIWEADYKVELTDAVSQMPAIRYYPGLFKNYSSGKNTCWGAFPPYRGRIGTGWVQLGRFDERIRLLMQQFTQSMYRGEVIRFLPPGTGCSMTASNANYNDVTNIIAETLYQMKLAGPSTSYNYKTGSTIIPSCDPNTSALTGTGDSECFWKYRFVVPASSSEKIKKMVVFFSGGEMGCGMDPAVNNYEDVMKEYAKDNYIAVCVQTYPDSTKSGVYPFHKEANRINTVLHSIRTNPDIQIKKAFNQTKNR
jgi:hypothetical protein